MNKLIILIILFFACALAALLDGAPRLGGVAKSLGLIGGILLVVLAFWALLRAPGEANDPRPENPGRDRGPDPIIYPDPPEETPDLLGPGPERFAPRGELREAEVVRRLPPMRREPMEKPIPVEPDTIFAPRSNNER